jgi:hypothetical protein
MSTILGSEGNAGQTEGNAGGDSGAGQGGSGQSSGQSSGSGSAQSWRDTLPEEIRAHSSLSSFQDVGSLAKSFIHAQSLIGKKGVVVPGEKSTDEEWNNFYKSIGVPEADKYEVSTPKDVQVNEAAVKAFKENAHKAGLLPKQANQLLGWFTKFEQDQMASHAETRQQELKSQIEGLKKEWGEGYEKEVETAKFAVREVGGDEFTKHLNKTGFGNDPQLIKFMSKVAKLLGEDKLREGGIGEGADTTNDIRAQMDELRANGNENGLFEKSHPNHKVVMAKFENLAKRMTGGR